MKVKGWCYESTAHVISSDIQQMIVSGEVTEVIALTMSVSDGGHKAHNAILIYK